MSVNPDSVISSREPSLIPAETQDVEMTEMTEEPTEQELTRQRKSELLQSIQSRRSFKWRQLTDEFIQDTSNIDDFILRIDNDVDIANDIFYEIIYSAKYHPDRLPIAKLGEILDNLSETPKSGILFFKFMKLFNTFSIDDNLRSLIENFKKLPNIDIAKHSSNPDFIQERNIIKEYKKASGVQSLKLVQQRKFNLMAESNEGYAKLIALVNMAFEADDSYYQIDYTAKAIERLTGHFNLDPLRVLDILLDIILFSISYNHRFAIDLLKKTSFWPKVESDCSSLETLNEGGSDLAALLIGAKLKASSEMGKDLPDGIKTGIAIFIKKGFVSFGAILKYVGPDDSVMDELSEYTEKKVEEEIFKSSANALALSGPLVDDEEEQDENSKTKSKDQQKPKESESKKERRLLDLNYKLQITKSLLGNGVYWPSIYMLNKYPYLIDSDPEFTQLILRVFNVIIQPLKDNLQILNKEQKALLLTEQRVALAQTATRNDSFKFDDYGYSRIESFKPLAKSHTNKIFTYFDTTWADYLPKAQNYEDLFKFSHNLLSFLGAKLAEDLPLVSYLCEFGLDDLNKSIGNDEEYQIKLQKWFNYFQKFILPASTAIGDNPITSSDIYKVLSKFPLDWRYNLYGNLYQNTSKSDLSVKLNYMKAEKQTKDMLKRITKDNVKPMMRRLAKITFSNPLPSFLIVLQQVENYDNLTNLIIEAARYFTDYAWDVLPFALLIRLTASNRVAVQSDGLNDSPWLQSLASFIGKLAKRYSSFNLNPILTYIVKDLHQKNTVGLTILREIINNMGGIQPLTNLSLNQINLLNSSLSLQKIARKVILDTRDESKESATRLIKELAQSNRLSEIFVLLVNFAKKLAQDDYEDDGEDAAFLKILSQKMDEITNVLHTYIELINFFSKDDVFDESVVGISELISKYRTDPSWAFELWRKHLSGDNKDGINFTDVEFDDLSRDLYYDYWKFDLYDIQCDDDLYNFEKNKLIQSNESNTNRIPTMRAKMTSQVKEIEDEKEALRKTISTNKLIIENIAKDLVNHKAHTESILSTIKESFTEKWFTDSKSVSDEEIQSFIQYCVIPRALQSSSDSIFSVRFITNSFENELSQRIITLLLESDILHTLIFSLTPLEAENLGVFFADVFSYYEKLRANESTSKEEKIIIYQWHVMLLEILETGIKSENYMSRRNSITLLKNLIGIYPIIEDQKEHLVTVIQKVSESETRNDLKLASAAILSLIHSRSKNLIHLWDFYERDTEERETLIKERKEVLKEREEEKLRLKREASKKEREDRLKLYQRPPSEPVETKSEEKEKSSKPEETASADKPEEDTAVVSDEDEIIDIDDEDDQKPEEVNKVESKVKPTKSEEKNGHNNTKAPKDEVKEVKKNEKAQGDESKTVEKKETVESSKAKPEADNKKEADTPKIPTGPSSQSRGKFADVTAGLQNNAGRNASINKYDILRSIVDALNSGGLPAVYRVIDDRLAVRSLQNSQHDTAKVQDILLDYAAKLFGSKQGQAVKTFGDNIKKYFNATESRKPSIRSRKPLEPQESTIGGFSNTKSTKWGMNNRTIPNRGDDNRRNNYGNSGGQYNQGYRTKPLNNNGVPPPPPPPPSTSGSSNNKRSSDSRRFESDKRFRKR